MTIDNVIQGVVDAVNSAFGSITIYTESVKQDLATPAAIIRCLSSSQGRDLGRRFKKSVPVVVQYIPANTDDVNLELNAASDALHAALVDIEVSGRIFHGHDLSGVIANDVLTYEATYDGFLLDEQTETDMATVAIDIDATDEV